MSSVRAWLSSSRAWLSGRPRLLFAAIVLMAFGLFTSTVLAAWFCYTVASALPGRKEIRGIGDMAQASIIYDRHDAPVFTIYKEQRVEVPLARISPNVVKAVLATEDQRFYDHAGVDLIRIAAAGIRNLHEGRRAEGGSTITQQLARQSFLNRDKTFRRKFKEVILAAQIEREYSKDDILEMYLNKVYFGDGLYGVEAASLGYFGRHASQLTIDQAALLAGLIQSPSSYAPTVNLDRAVSRRNVVLQAMLDAHAIDARELERARRAPVHLAGRQESRETFGQYFKEEVRKTLVETFGRPRIAQGGLRVYTTLDSGMQKAAEKAVEAGISAIERRPRFAKESKEVKESKAKDSKDSKERLDYLQGALVALEPHTGEVRAMVGGRDFGESPFNRAMQARRQAGSAFKPFVYAAALEAGYSPATVISNLDAPILTAQGRWMPEDEHSSATSLTLRAALRMSSNRAAVQLLDAVGIERAVSYAQKLNVGTPPSVPSLALGAGDVTLMSMTTAYAAFADEGTVHAPVFIRRVEDGDGKILYQAQAKAERAITPESAFLMTSMLSDVINAGTAYRARQSGFTLPAAGKTGTTNDYVDAWFLGYTPHLATGVWVGFDRPKTIVANGYAADLAVPIWGSFMKAATKGDPPDQFPRPDSIVAVSVCRVSGKLPNAGCSSVPTMDENGFLVELRSMVYTDYFVKGTEPTTMCPLHPGGAYADAVAGTSGAGAIPPPASATGLVPARPPLSPPEHFVEPPAPPTPQDQSQSQGQGQSQSQNQNQNQKKKGFWRRLFGRGGGG